MFRLLKFGGDVNFGFEGYFLAITLLFINLAGILRTLFLKNTLFCLL
jgi:hypothetical protein